MQVIKIKNPSGSDIHKHALPLTKIHLMFGSFLICIGVFSALFQLSMTTFITNGSEFYPVYTGAMFCVSTGLAATTLALVEGFSEMAMGVIIFDVVNTALAGINIVLSINTTRMEYLVIFMGLQITVIALSMVQVFLLFAFLCPICSKARHEYEEAEDCLILTLEGEYKKPQKEKAPTKSNDGSKVKQSLAIPKEKDCEIGADKVDPAKPEKSDPKSTTPSATPSEMPSATPKAQVEIKTEVATKKPETCKVKPETPASVQQSKPKTKEDSTDYQVPQVYLGSNFKSGAYRSTGSNKPTEE